MGRATFKKGASARCLDRIEMGIVLAFFSAFGVRKGNTGKRLLVPLGLGLLTLGLRNGVGDALRHEASVGSAGDEDYSQCSGLLLAVSTSQPRKQ